MCSDFRYLHSFTPKNDVKVGQYLKTCDFDQNGCICTSKCTHQSGTSGRRPSKVELLRMEEGGYKRASEASYASEASSRAQRAVPRPLGPQASAASRPATTWPACGRSERSEPCERSEKCERSEPRAKRATRAERAAQRPLGLRLYIIDFVSL